MKLQLLVERATVTFGLIFFLLPVLWLITVAYMPGSAIFASPPTLSFTPTLKNFDSIFTLFDIPKLVANSIIISCGTTILSLIIGTPAGYALARSQSRFAPMMAYFFLAVRMIPTVATLIPFYLVMRNLGLLGTWWGVIMLHTILNTAFVVWMMYAYFRSLPKELEEAALTDGCTQFGAFFKISLPLVKPGIIACALFTMLLSWNDFLIPSFLTNASTKPISVALLSAFGVQGVTWGTLGALAHFSTIPIVIMTLFLNRYFVQGLTKGVH
jgi:multiple sugar transport system permease protein